MHVSRRLSKSWRAGCAGALVALPGWAQAEGGLAHVELFDGFKLPAAIAAALALHVLLGRAAKFMVATWSPIVRGEAAVGGYSRSVYGTAHRVTLGVLAAVVASGVVLWAGIVSLDPRTLALGGLAVLGAVGLDLWTWQRVAVSANFVWIQRGVGRRVHQFAIEKIRDVTVVEEPARGFTLRHLTNNRVCRLSLMLRDKRVVSLPKTDARLGLAAVERVAGLVRERLGINDSRQGTHHAHPPTTLAPEPPARVDPERDLMRELIRLRRHQAQAESARRAEQVLSS